MGRWGHLDTQNNLGTFSEYDDIIVVNSDITDVYNPALPNQIKLRLYVVVIKRPTVGNRKEP